MNTIKILIPYLLTITRLLTGPVYLLAGSIPAPPAQICLLLLVVLTDVIDGPLARYFGTTSRVGAALDTTADKGFVISVFLKLALAGILPKWLLWILIAQYLVIAVEGSIYVSRFSLVPVPDAAARIAAALAFATVLVGVMFASSRARAEAKPRRPARLSAEPSRKIAFSF